MKKRVISAFVFLILLILLNFTVAHADTQSPTGSYIKEINEDYIFVMVVKGEDCFIKSITDEVYPQSGLYPSDGTVEPIWIIDFYAYEMEIVISDDGINLIRSLFVGTSSLEQVGVELYSNGVLNREYKISEFIKSTDDLPQTTRHKIWYTKSEIKDGFLEIITLEGKKVVFDLVTGEIIYIGLLEEIKYKIQDEKTPFTYFYIIIGVLLVGFIIIGAFLSKNSRRRKRKHFFVRRQ